VSSDQATPEQIAPAREPAEESDDKAAILRAYLKRWKVEVGVFFQGVSDESPESELRRIVPDHPVFRVEPVQSS